VIGPSLHKRVEFLRHLLPLQFIYLSRSLTLLIGFALVISSLNVYKRKRLAWWMVAALAAFSVVFHLTKGVDYEEATISIALLAMLVATRPYFTVRSRAIHWREAILRAALALGLALTYGVTGFWLLDPREFGVDFHWGQALDSTLSYLLLAHDPWLTPHTHYAAWFLRSLYLITLSAFLYTTFSLFRPALYQFRTHPREKERAARILAAHGRCALDFYKVRPDKSFFFSNDRTCFLAYRVGGSFAVVLGDPVGPADRVEGIMREFTAYCHDNDWGLGFHQVLPDFLDVYRHLGFKKLKVGDDAIVDLKEFTLQGKAARQLRSKVSTLEKEGVHSEYHEPPIPEVVMAEIKEVSDEWLQIPGRRERQFTLGMFDDMYLRTRPVFVARDAREKMLAFVNIVPSYRPGEATVDMMRRRSEAPNGIMDYVFAKLLLRNKEMGFERFTLGMAPMDGFHHGEQASPEERAIHAFFQRLNFLFSFKGLLNYKAKFATSWEPRYVIYRNVLDLPRLAIALSRVSELGD
jgi:phosphatidylglycerol lysyltransferase